MAAAPSAIDDAAKRPSVQFPPCMARALLQVLPQVLLTSSVFLTTADLNVVNHFQQWRQEVALSERGLVTTALLTQRRSNSEGENPSWFVSYRLALSEPQPHSRFEGEARWSLFWSLFWSCCFAGLLGLSCQSGCAQLRDAHLLRRDGQEVNGRITQLWSREDSEGQTFHYVAFAFRPPGQPPHQPSLHIAQPLPSTPAGPYALGQDVRIRFLPQRPRLCRLL